MLAPSVAKTVIQIHDMDRHGRAILRTQLKRKQAPMSFGNLGPVLTGMEARGNANDWARKLLAFGTPRYGS
ncbi:MAG: hypothetical protein ACYDB1_13495 [Acidiferrobacteraceae bacterium]